MRRHTTIKLMMLLSMILLILTGCHNNNKQNISLEIPTTPPMNNGLVNGWLSTYDYWIDNEMVCFDWSGYQPSDGTAIVYYERPLSGEVIMHTSQGNSIMESLGHESAFRIAIWYGDSSLINDVRERNIPEYAWQYYVTSFGNIIQSSKEYFYQETPIHQTCIPTQVPTAKPYRPKYTEKPRPTATPKPTEEPDFSWYIQFTGINTNEKDNNTYSNNLRVGDCVYFHAHLSGGAPNETILPYYEICMNGEFIESSSFSGVFSNGSDIWVRNSPFRYGTLSIRIFYYANGGNGREIELGRTSVHISAREDGTQTEIAKGWARGVDIYFDRYNNLCFDLTNYNSANKAIIWFSKNESSSSMTQSTVVGGQIIWDTPVPGLITEYAIWVGDYHYSQDVAALSASQIPDTAWIKLYITDDKQVKIISSDVTINIKDNE